MQMQAAACTLAAMVKRQKATCVHKTHLKYVGISPRTVKRYSTAVLHYFAYLVMFNLTYPESPEELDQSLSEYINMLWQEDEPLGYAQDLVHGFVRFLPRVRRNLAISRQYLNSRS